MGVPGGVKHLCIVTSPYLKTQSHKGTCWAGGNQIGSQKKYSSPTKIFHAPTVVLQLHVREMEGGREGEEVKVVWEMSKSKHNGVTHQPTWGMLQHTHGNYMYTGGYSKNKAVLLQTRQFFDAPIMTDTINVLATRGTLSHTQGN